MAVLDSMLKEIAPLKRVFDAIEAQILNGKTYLGTSKVPLELLNTDPDVFQATATFFRMTAEGGLQLAEMTIACLNDKTKGTVTIRTLLDQAKHDIGSFQFGNEKQVSDAIAAALADVNELEPILNAIKLRRNKWFAH